jgi:hypothetical protein
MLEPIRYQNKMMQSDIFLLRYRTEMTDAGMPMPALVLRMQMPNYGVLLPSILLATASTLTMEGSTTGAVRFADCSFVLTLKEVPAALSISPLVLA